MSNVSKIKNNVSVTNLKLPSYKTLKPSSSIINTLNDNLIDEVELNPDNNSLNYEKIVDDGYTPQGVTNIDGKILISAYKDGLKSRIYIFDEKTNKYEGKLILDNKAHVGGISYDEDNKIIFVTGSSGKVNTYSYEKINTVINTLKKTTDINEYTIDFSNFNDDSSGECFFKIKSDININAFEKMDSKAATTYYYDGRLYIGSFEGINSGVLVSYKLTYDKKKNTLEKSNPLVCGLPSATQGIAVTNYNGTKYLVTTQSIFISPSTITLFEITNKGIKSIGKKYLNDSGIEGINIDNNGNIIAVFENGRNEVLSTNIDELKSTLDSHNVITELGQDIFGFAYEVNAKVNEIKNEIKEKIDDVF